MADLRQRTNIPIAAGTHLGLHWLYKELVTRGAADIVLPNVVCSGGYTGAVKIAHMAQVHNVPIVNGGSWPYHNAILHTAVPNGGLVEFHAYLLRSAQVLFVNPPQPKNGAVTLPEGPSLGYEVNEESLQRYLVK